MTPEQERALPTDTMEMLERLAPYGITTVTCVGMMTAGQCLIALDAQRETIRQKDELIRDLVEAATLTLSRLQADGDWDDGCFYYNGTSASELQLPIEKLQSALKKRKE